MSRKAKRKILGNWKNDHIGRWSHDLVRATKNVWTPKHLDSNRKSNPELIQCIMFGQTGCPSDIKHAERIKR